MVPWSTLIFIKWPTGVEHRGIVVQTTHVGDLAGSGGGRARRGAGSAVGRPRCWRIRRMTTVSSTSAAGGSPGRLVRSASSVESVGGLRGERLVKAWAVFIRSEAYLTTVCGSCGKGAFSAAFPRTLWARSWRPEVRQLPQAAGAVPNPGSRESTSESRVFAAYRETRFLARDATDRLMFAPQNLRKTLRSGSLSSAFRNYDDVFLHAAAGRCSARASCVSSMVKSSRVNVHSNGRAAASCGRLESK
jgi:hypothetical protein